MGEHEVLKPTATQMSEVFNIPESVSPEGLRERANLMRSVPGFESCARHLELAADEIEKLKKRKLADSDPELEASAYETAVDLKARETRFLFRRENKVLGWIVFSVEELYDMGTHALHIYDKLEGI